MSTYYLIGLLCTLSAAVGCLYIGIESSLRCQEAAAAGTRPSVVTMYRRRSAVTLCAGCVILTLTIVTA